MSALSVLYSARELVRHGWARKGLALDADGRETFSAVVSREHPVFFSLVGAVLHAEVEKDIDREHAKQALRRIIRHHNLAEWNDHPLRTQREVLALFDAAIESLGGTAPRTGPARIGAGGWSVATQPIRAPQQRAAYRSTDTNQRGKHMASAAKLRAVTPEGMTFEQLQTRNAELEARLEAVRTELQRWSALQDAMGDGAATGDSRNAFLALLYRLLLDAVDGKGGR